jgi:hypothetical protein
VASTRLGLQVCITTPGHTFIFDVKSPGQGIPYKMVWYQVDSEWAVKISVVFTSFKMNLTGDGVTIDNYSGRISWILCWLSSTWSWDHLTFSWAFSLSNTELPVDTPALSAGLYGLWASCRCESSDNSVHSFLHGDGSCFPLGGSEDRCVVWPQSAFS